MNTASSDGHGAALFRHLLGELLQVDAVDQFHADEIKPARLAQMVGLDDVGVDQVGHQLGLADEILDELLLAGVVLADDLHGHALDKIARAVLLGLVDHAHAAFENLADNLVAELALNGEQRCHADDVPTFPRQVKFLPEDFCAGENRAPPAGHSYWRRGGESGAVRLGSRNGEPA